MSVLILGKYYEYNATDLFLYHGRLTQIPPEIGQLQQLQKILIFQLSPMRKRNNYKSANYLDP